MLAIEVAFLTGRYVATAYNNRLEPEWPPHPARLFSALVATHFSTDAPSPEERAALLWLETLEAPSIRASDASARDVATVFVPVNDVAMTNVDAEAASLDEARIALEAARASGVAKAIKAATSQAKKAENRLSAAIARSVGVPKASANPAAALQVLPEHRVRQPRTFPSVTPEEPRVTYVWPAAEPTASHRTALDALLARLVRLGHSSSLVAARLVEGDVSPVWRPAVDGEVILRAVQPGQLEALQRSFQLHKETEPRVMPARFQGYTRLTPDGAAAMPRSVFSEDWLLFRRVGGPSPPIVACTGVARAFRGALMSYARSVPELLSGHGPEGEPSTRDHLAVVALPFVGHRQASGAILGVALVLPRDCPPEERRVLYEAIDRWENVERSEDEDTPRLSLLMGRAGTLEIERVEWGAVQSSLRPPTWCRPAQVWSSVTPVALDRNPGDLRSREPEKLMKALAEAEDTVRRACERIGLPQPVAVEILPAAPWAGAAKAKVYPAYPEAPERTRRVLTHVRVRFDTMVRGPILLGAGRYLGLGLLRPEPSDE